MAVLQLSSRPHPPYNNREVLLLLIANDNRPLGSARLKCRDEHKSIHNRDLCGGGGHRFLLWDSQISVIFCTVSIIALIYCIFAAVLVAIPLISLDFTKLAG
jgi:hypothetical protein